MLVELALLGLLVLLLYKWIQLPRDMPPGPRCYPVLGNRMLQTDEDFRSLQKEYGDIVSTRFGSHYGVILFNYKTAREAHSRSELSDRPDWEALHFLSEGEGVVFSSGPVWQSTRRFLLKQLRDMGMGKSRLDEAILIEARSLVEDLHNYTDVPTHFPKSINIVILNVIWQLVASKRYDLHDEEILTFFSKMREFQENFIFMVLPDIFTFLKYIPDPIYSKMFRRDVVQKNVVVARNMMQAQVDDHKRTLDPTNPRDVIDAYLLEMEAQEKSGDPHFNEKNLLACIFDLFAAGFDNTAHTLRWMILYMVKYPKVQERIQKEIDKVVDRDTLPANIHRPRLVYLDATLNEVHRIASPVQSSAPHTANVDTYIDGYMIPKGTMVNACIAVIHKDSRYWDNPDEFIPERFIDEDGNLISKKDGFFPFGVGKRSCLGEALVRMELFLFAAALLQNFTFAPPVDGEIDLGYQPLPGLHAPKDQDILITARK